MQGRFISFNSVKSGLPVGVVAPPHDLSQASYTLPKIMVPVCQSAKDYGYSFR